MALHILPFACLISPPPPPKDDLEDLAGRFRGDLAALERLVDPSRQKKQNKKHAKAADELDHLLAAVVAAEEKLKRNPNDKNAQKELQELAEALERPLKELADIYSVPDDEVSLQPPPILTPTYTTHSHLTLSVLLGSNSCPMQRGEAIPQRFGGGCQEGRQQRLC